MKRELLTPVIVVTGIVGVVTGIVTGKKVIEQLHKRKKLKNATIINPDGELRKFTETYVTDEAGKTTLHSKER